MSIRKRVYEILDVAKADDWISRVVDISIMVLISLSVLATIVESVEEIFVTHRAFFKVFEGTSLAIFLIEYALRLWCCKEDPRYARGWGRVSYFFSLLALVDLFAILPGLLIITGLDFRFLRAIRLLRLFRLTRYNRNFVLITEVLATSKQALIIALTGIVVILLVVSSLIYTVEHTVNPEGFASIPRAMWWGVVTLTTVGYGDVYPITGLGKLLASVVALLGIGTFAVPAGILAGAFNIALSNVAPALDNTAVNDLDSIEENDVKNKGTLISKIIKGAVIDHNIDDPKGIAITEIDAKNGCWEYYKHSTKHWYAINHVNIVAALLLPCDDHTKVRFVPKKNFTGKASFRFHAWDQYTGKPFGFDDASINGGSNAYSSQEAITTIHVKKKKKR